MVPDYPSLPLTITLHNEHYTEELVSVQVHIEEKGCLGAKLVGERSLTYRYKGQRQTVSNPEGASLTETGLRTWSLGLPEL